MPSFVRAARPHSYGCSCRLVALLLPFLLWGVGCRAAEPEAPGGSRFGAPYEVVVSASSAAPDVPPALHGDTLVVTVAYPGGEETHGFSLGHASAGDTTRLWLCHDARGDDGSERVFDDLRQPLPPEALRTPLVLLLNPQGGEPFVLRWPDEAEAPGAAARKF